MNTKGIGMIPAGLVALWLLAILAGPASGQSVLLPAGSVWRYLDDGTDQGTAWRDPLFNDSGWNSGPAQLGYGDGDEATVVGFGPDPDNKYITTFFRHSFEVGEPSLFPYLQLRLLRDDGAVIHLNGMEILRSNMPAAGINHLTPASSTVRSSEEDAYFDHYIDSSGLVSGTNVLAVEIHQINPTSSDLSFDLEILGLESPPNPFRKTPYLVFTGDSSRMQVQWQLAFMDSCLIEWGPDQSCGSGSEVTYEYGVDHQHTFTIGSLTPSATCFYRVTAGETVISASFRAAPPGDAADVSFLVYGDTRTYPADHDDVAAGIVSTMTTDPGFHSLVLNVGDLVSDGDQEEDWDTEFFDSSYTNIRTMMAGLPLQACRGNHEGAGILFSKYFTYPVVAPLYWSFDYGPAHFIVMDQYVGYAPGSAQHDWLEADLAGTTKPWKFLVLHEPGWSAGGHGNNTSVQDYLQPLCLEFDVPIVFAGHNHYYARAVVDNVQHVTTGGGGAPLYTPNPGYPNIVATEQTHHYCTIGIEGNHLTFTAISAAGDTIDQFTISKPASPVEGPDLGQLSRAVVLGDAFPNPFNPVTTISYSNPETSPVTLEVLNIDGEVVRTLVAGIRPPGEQQVTWNGTDHRDQPVSSGVYFYRLTVGENVLSKKMVLLK